jgi:3-oxoacyl-[acyl-carrier protein] reductase
MPTTPLIISGGSRGLGLVMARHCLKRGCAVATFARSKTQSVADLERDYADNYFFTPVDSSNPQDLENFVEAAAKRFGSIYGLVNNAAIGQDHLLAHTPLDVIDSLLAVNLKGPILLTRAVLRKLMLNPEGGRIVNITSICATRGYPALTVYSATKGGLESFTRSLARELGGRNILVNSIAPGFFPSAMSSSLAARQLETIRRRTPPNGFAKKKISCLCSTFYYSRTLTSPDKPSSSMEGPASK